MSNGVCVLHAGNAGRDEVHGGAVRNQDLEEGCGDPGRWCGVYYGWKEGVGTEGQATVPHPAPLLLSDRGKRWSEKKQSREEEAEETVLQEYSQMQYWVHWAALIKITF